MAELPEGTVTFLLTDIEGSTALLQRLGTEQFTEVLETHNRLVRTAITAHAGYVARTEGDAFVAVFRGAADAIAAAVDAQRLLGQHRWPAGVVIRVRMGLHTGEAVIGGDQYVGLEMHRAARIAAVAHGGQVLLSDATRALVANALPEGVSVRDLGTHRLKDLPHPERLFQLLVANMRSDFPPLSTPDAMPSRMPVQLTAFVGREREVAEGKRLLAHTRLLTLTGTGGTGKTRLGLQLAREVADQFPDGVYVTHLAPIGDPELVPAVILQAIGERDIGSRPPRERLLEVVRDKRLLLVLDNFEHLLPAATLVSDLLAASPNLRALVTSRAPLRVSGEYELQVPPLRLPDPEAPLTPEALARYEAVQLFVERATAARPDFRLDERNAPIVAAICARLDGLPLAIELAAARVKILPPAALLARLEHRLDLLDGGPRDLPDRQRTLRAAIGWSYDLLDEPAQRLFGRLAVFVGGATLEHIEAVCRPNAELGIDTLVGLDVLLDHSLVRQVEVAGEPRFAMLETIREYARERLDERGDKDLICRRHAQMLLELAGPPLEDTAGSRPVAWLNAVEREHDNYRAALRWAIDSGQTDMALQLGIALEGLWWPRGYLQEGRRWIEEALGRADTAPPLLRAQALHALGGLVWRQGHYDEAVARREEELALRREIGEPVGIAVALRGLASLARDRSDAARAVELFEEARAIFRQAGDKRLLAQATLNFGLSQHAAGKTEQAEALLEEALGLFHEVRHIWGTATALAYLGFIALEERGDAVRARALATKALTLMEGHGDRWMIAHVSYLLARVACVEGEVHHAARLLGTADLYLAALGSIVMPALRQQHAQIVAEVRSALDEEAFARAWAEGRHSPEQAIRDMLTSPTSAVTR